MKPLKLVLMLMFLSAIAVMSIGCKADKRATLQNNPSHKKPVGHFIGYATPWDWARQDQQLLQMHSPIMDLITPSLKLILKEMRLLLLIGLNLLEIEELQLRLLL